MQMFAASQSVKRAARCVKQGSLLLGPKTTQQRAEGKSQIDGAKRGCGASEGRGGCCDCNCRGCV